MRQSPEYIKIQKRMQPGSLTSEGFLGSDTRNLVDIMADDAQSVFSIGLTHDEIAQKMRYLTDIGAKQLERAIVIDNTFEVIVEEHRGIMPCPFADSKRLQKRNTHVTNIKTGESISWTDLNIHMIEAHGFYEGKDARFRVDPKIIARVLEIEKPD